MNGLNVLREALAFAKKQFCVQEHVMREQSQPQFPDTSSFLGKMAFPLRGRGLVAL
jgi:hypothetical protein